MLGMVCLISLMGSRQYGGRIELAINGNNGVYYPDDMPWSSGVSSDSDPNR